MSRLIAIPEAILDDEAWHVDLGEEGYVMSNYEVVDMGIYGGEDIIMADVVEKIRGSSAISSENKIEFEVSRVDSVRSMDGLRVIYSK
jgi:hypothetical protein